MDTYIKRMYEDEYEDVTIYLHFRGERAVRQIEVTATGIIKTSEKCPVATGTFLYDQNFSDIEWNPSDFISKEEFENVWDD